MIGTDIFLHFFDEKTEVFKFDFRGAFYCDSDD